MVATPYTDDSYKHACTHARTQQFNEINVVSKSLTIATIPVWMDNDCNLGNVGPDSAKCIFICKRSPAFICSDVTLVIYVTPQSGFLKMEIGRLPTRPQNRLIHAESYVPSLGPRRG
jgi:hypothetical protein